TTMRLPALRQYLATGKECGDEDGGDGGREQKKPGRAVRKLQQVEAREDEGDQPKGHDESQNAPRPVAPRAPRRTDPSTVDVLRVVLARKQRDHPSEYESHDHCRHIGPDDEIDLEVIGEKQWPAPVDGGFRVGQNRRYECGAPATLHSDSS